MATFGNIWITRDTSTNCTHKRLCNFCITESLCRNTPNYNISGAGSEEHDSITDNLSTGGKGGLSTGGQKEHDVEADGTTMELKDVKDEGDSGDVMSLVSVEGLELS